MEDEELKTTFLVDAIDRFQKGDDMAFSELLTRAEKRLQKLTRKIFRKSPMICQYEETADIYQETQIRLWKRLEKHRPSNTRQFYQLANREINQILINLANKYRGPEGLHTNLAQNLRVGTENSSSVYNPIDRVPSNDELRKYSVFHQAVRNLPETQKEIFELKYYQRLSSSEVGKIVGLEAKQVDRHYVTAALLIQVMTYGDCPG